MKQTLLALSLFLVLVGCSKEIKQESKTCTFNDRPVDCSVLEGNGSRTTTPTVTKTPLHVEGQLLFDLTLESGRDYLNILTALNPKASNNAGMNCELNIPREKFEIEIYEKNRLIVKFADGEMVLKYKLGSARSADSRLNGIWINEERNDVQREVLTLTFNNRYAMAKLDCIPL